MFEPVDLIDDGLRHVGGGKLRGFTFVSMQNPALVSAAIAEKKRRQMIAASNAKAYA